MLFFFDETFRTCRREPKRAFGAMCGIGMPEALLAPIAEDLFHLKRKVIGRGFAESQEIKGKELFKNWAFKIRASGKESLNLRLGEAVLQCIDQRRLPVFGAICFDPTFAQFRVQDVSSLDHTFLYLLERIDLWMKIYHPDEKALLVFDDRGYGINQKNAEAFTRFFQRASGGARFTSVLQTPFFGISQTHNVGLQLADIVATVIGLRFEGSADITPYFQQIKKCIPEFPEARGFPTSGLKVLRHGYMPSGRRQKKHAGRPA